MVGQGLAAVEALIGDDGFCFGPEPMLVDVCRLPQLCAARRFGVPLEAYPRILRVEKVAGEHPAFLRAHPANQPDAEESSDPTSVDLRVNDAVAQDFGPPPLA